MTKQEVKMARRTHDHPVPKIECRNCEGTGIGGDYVPELMGEGEDQECDECKGSGSIELPWRYEVCDRCEGRGTQCRIGAMTGSEYHEHCHDDPDFPENYKSGMYDEPCQECRGLRVVAVVDRERCHPDQLEVWDKQCEAEAEREAHDRYVDRMGF
jgi:DnaJ-class molecular chaperone